MVSLFYVHQAVANHGVYESSLSEMYLKSER